MWGWALLISLIAAAIATGYGIFVFFLKGFNPTSGTLSILLFAIVGGIATFFSPCSFPLMPGFLSRHIQTLSEKESDSLSKRALSNGASAAAGVVLFDMILGLGVTLLGSAFGASLALSGPNPNIYVRIFRGLVGLILLVLGTVSLRGTGIFHNDALTSWGSRLINRVRPGSNSYMFAYGFAYVSVGIGCSGPILSGLLIFALSFAGALDAVLAFLLFAATMAGLMIGTSLLVNTSPSTLSALTHNAPRIKKIASSVQIAAGVFLILAAYYNSLFVQLLFPK